MENEDADPVEAVDPVATYTRLAIRCGVIRAGETLDQRMIEFAASLVDECASIGDAYGDGEAGGNAGEHIRSELWPY